MSEGCVSLPSPAAEEGTLAHDLAAKVLLGGRWPSDMDPEMRDFLRVYTNHCKKLGEGHNCILFIEQRIDLTSVVDEAFGTLDFGVYRYDTQELIIRDLKYGTGIVVEPEENDQLLYYALGLIYHLNRPVKKVDVGIVQPRVEHERGVIRNVVYDIERVEQFEEELTGYAKAALSPDAPLVPGKVQCRFCPAVGKCPEAEKASLSAAQEAFDLACSDRTTYDGDRVGQILDRLQVVEGWAKAFREYAYVEAMRGNMPSGYKLVAKRPRRQWAKGTTIQDVSATVELAQDQVVEKKLKSPAQVEKAVRDAFQGEKRKTALYNLEEITVKESSGLKLVKYSESGTPVVTGAEAAFGEISAPDSDDVFN